MKDKVFFDTNILVYSRDASEPVKQHIANRKLMEAWNDRTGCISTQVLNEFFVTVTRKLKPGLSKEDAWQDMRALAAWNPIPITMESLSTSYDVQNSYGTSWWDSLIIAAAYRAGAKQILSEDLNSGQKYLGIEVVNPFNGL